MPLAILYNNFSWAAFSQMEKTHSIIQQVCIWTVILRQKCYMSFLWLFSVRTLITSLNYSVLLRADRNFWHFLIEIFYIRQCKIISNNHEVMLQILQDILWLLSRNWELHSGKSIGLSYLLGLGYFFVGGYFASF